jgi:TRAP-type mannitol/chloroaromatic compound transport system permease small subunit
MSVSASDAPSAGYLATIRFIDRFTEVSGVVFCAIVAPLIVANTYEVISRYIFGAPTEWALDVTTQSYAALFMLGAPYALLKGAHVRTDMLWEKFTDRTKGAIDALAFAVLFLPTMAVLVYMSYDDFLYALSINERSNTTSWQPIIWPLRAVIPLSCALMFIQGISELMKSFHAARTGKFLVHHEKIEI